MVYSGKPSAGCQNCRKRHIKCDEARPHCKACTKTGRSCPGYKHPFDVVLRDQTSFFIAPSPTGVRLSPSPNGKCDASQPWRDPNSTASKKSTGSSVSLVKERPPADYWPRYQSPNDLYLPLKSNVLPLFFNSYLYLPKDPHVRNGFMEFLPNVYAEAKTDSHLHSATMAVAFFAVAAWTGQSSLLKLSEKYFTKALPKLRDALISEVINEEYDLILTSILLLSTYEVLSLMLLAAICFRLMREIKEFAAMKDSVFPAKAHLKGAVALINSNKRAPAHQTASTFPLYQAVQTHIIKTTRGLASPMVPKPEIWPLAQVNPTPSPRNFLSTAASALVELRQAWDEVNVRQPDESDLISLLNKATQVDIGLNFMVILAASTLAPSTSNNNPPLRPRMLVQSIMLNCFRLLPSKDPDGVKSAQAQSTLRSLADDVCASVPYFLGSQVRSVRMVPDLVDYPYSEDRPVTSTHKMSAPLMGPWHIFPYLRNLQTSTFGLPPEQLSWIETQLERILVIYFQR
ncbi:hypothetical protein N7468_009465 [Penicillium chermesinum]|uniref:Zn(2)-C6 fungal-type domain-containing protein n=1 Tax=Penicillium chermesinum TaxID=63820 RepID=A0A9W9NHU2_9EURO|nr:uncharacterized protein N7468_009465 [Penicillium chermesinum]KAJ5220261.1 hypothetical protein N7468_009465 [Penicillium chermesinum]